MRRFSGQRRAGDGISLLFQYFPDIFQAVGFSGPGKALLGIILVFAFDNPQNGFPLLVGQGGFRVLDGL